MISDPKMFGMQNTDLQHYRSGILGDNGQMEVIKVQPHWTRRTNWV